MRDHALPKFTSVRTLRPDEPHWFGISGHYIDGKNGKQYELTSPEASTIRYMARLESAKLQFDFFCLAILRHHAYILRRKDATECSILWQELRDTFDESPWYGQAKYIMPYDDFSYKVVDYETGSFDMSEAERLYRDVCKSFYVLYR